MNRYGKLWAALVGTAGVAASSFGLADEAQTQVLVTTGLSLLSAFGVWRIPNATMPGQGHR